jgi:hypothetical protein
MRTLHSLNELAELVDDRDDLYVRWSRGPHADQAERSRDELTGVELPGLSASALSLEPWWDGRSRLLWVARRLYDYRHLQAQRRNVCAWVLQGRECGRGPDNEPLVALLRPVAWVGGEVVNEAARLVEHQQGDWGPLERPSASDSPSATHEENPR